MCQATTCQRCYRPTWVGCGMHVESVLAHVPHHMRCRLNNKEFTNSLRDQLKERFKEDPDKTLGYYQKKYSHVMLDIKRELLKFVPKNSTFASCWKKVSDSLKMDKASKKP
ncbi:hypothetical protein BpHYR1_053269 [Brachionus plicatilis]|uniref:Uncharacterized protein n=1 Tax=Brachionus plicatilis TaxID=10195 RepID=A0A3M7T1A8_BRAPC|nr:hypothetical protein BpHYR1_053269 [Brachionus plicatilis]